MRAPLTWKSLLIRGAAALALFALANLITYSSCNYFERERAYHAEVSGYFDRPTASAVFAGDSHVAQLENSLLSDNAYNIAWGGDSLREVYAKLRYLLARGARINTLFLTADPHMFSADRLQSSNRAFVDEYLLLTASPYGLEHGWPSAALGTVPLFNDDFVQYLKKKITVSLRREPDTDVHQDAAAWASLSEQEREEQARSAGQEDHVGIGQYPEPFLWYERIAALAHAHDIRIVAIQYPSHRAYVQAIPPEAETLIHARLAQFGIHEMIDLRNVFSDPSLFSDPDHVSRNGAIALLQLLSKRTGRELLAQGVASAALPAMAPAARAREEPSNETATAMQ